MILEDHRGLIV